MGAGSVHISVGVRAAAVRRHDGLRDLRGHHRHAAAGCAGGQRSIAGAAGRHQAGLAPARDHMRGPRSAVDTSHSTGARIGAVHQQSSSLLGAINQLPRLDESLTQTAGWPHICHDPARSLGFDLAASLVQLLVKDPEERLTLVQLAAHPWTTADGMRPLNLRQTADSVAVRNSLVHTAASIHSQSVPTVGSRHCEVRAAKQCGGADRRVVTMNKAVGVSAPLSAVPPLELEHAAASSAVVTSYASHRLHSI